MIDIETWTGPLEYDVDGGNALDGFGARRASADDDDDAHCEHNVSTISIKYTYCH